MSQIFSLLAGLAQLYALLLLVRAIISWVPSLDPYNPLVRLVYQATDPVLEPVRRLIPAVGGLDISFLVVFFGLQFLARILRDISQTF